MIDPSNIKSPITDRNTLEEFLVFAICVAGKPAFRTAQKVEQLLDCWLGSTPFKKIRNMIRWNTLGLRLRAYGLGQYRRIEAALRRLVDLDLANLTVEVLEEIPGIGPKTARFVMLYHKPELACVPLDTHILAYLRERGYNAPLHTPGSRVRYNELEAAFKVEANKLGVSVLELDTRVWNARALRATPSALLPNQPPEPRHKRGRPRHAAGSPG